MNNQHFSVFISSFNNADMGIVVVKCQVTRLRILPRYRNTIVVLHRRPTAMAGIVNTVRCIIKKTIDKAGAIQTIRSGCTRCGATGCRDLAKRSPSGVPPDCEAFPSPKIVYLSDKRTRCLDYLASLRRQIIREIS